MLFFKELKRSIGIELPHWIDPDLKRVVHNWLTFFQEAADVPRRIHFNVLIVNNDARDFVSMVCSSNGRESEKDRLFGRWLSVNREHIASGMAVNITESI